MSEMSEAMAQDVKISPKDDWDKIEKAFRVSRPNTTNFHKCKAALEIKSAIESIKNAKELTSATIEAGKNTGRLVSATRMLAVFTIVLALATLLYTGIGYMAYKSSQKQTEALKALTQAVVELPKARVVESKP